MGCPVHEGFDPLSEAFLADPYAIMAKLPGGFQETHLGRIGRNR